MESGAAHVPELREADRARGNLDGVTWEVALASRDGDRTSELTVAVRARGYDFLGETLAPAKYEGRKLLMMSGTMWFYRPGLSKPVPIAKRQRLLGQAAYGDIAATDYADEYDAVLVGEEVYEGEPCRVFDLTARDKTPTYDRIRYWISSERGVGIHAEYFTVSGKVIKTATMEYEHTAVRGTNRHPFISRIEITDALDADAVTTMVFGEPEFTELPDHVFNLNLLGR